MSIHTIPHKSILPSFYQMDITPSVLVSQLWWIRTDIREDFLSGKGVVQKPTNTHLNYSECVIQHGFIVPYQPYLIINITKVVQSDIEW